MQKKLTNFELIFIIAAIIKILGLVYRFLLSRILTIEGMRIVSMILPTLTLMLSLSSFSISTVVNQNVASRATNTKTILKSALNITLTTSTIISIILLFSFPIYTKIYNNSFIYYPLILCIPLIYFSNISGIIKGYLEANNKYVISYVSNILEQIAKFIITFTLLMIFKDKNIDLLKQWFNYARYGTRGLTVSDITPNLEYKVVEYWCSWGDFENKEIKTKIIENIDIENTESDALTLSLTMQIQGENN